MDVFSKNPIISKGFKNSVQQNVTQPQKNRGSLYAYWPWINNDPRSNMTLHWTGTIRSRSFPARGIAGQVAHETETVIYAWALITNHAHILLSSRCQSACIAFLKELRMGSRRSCISQVRMQIAYKLVQDYEIPLAEVARQFGVSMSAISKAITRRTKE